MQNKQKYTCQMLAVTDSKNITSCTTMKEKPKSYIQKTTNIHFQRIKIQYRICT